MVDLWGGSATPEHSRPWTGDTLVHVYSTTKGITALCAHRLVDQGELDLRTPVSEIWPEFAQAGKSAIPVAWLLAHRAALPAIRAPLPPECLYDWTATTTALAAEAPWWTPGRFVGYHPVTFGWLVGEVVRRVSGRSPGRYFREEIAEPLGVDFHIGLGDAEISRCADITMLEPPAELDFSKPSLGAEPNLVMLAFMNPMGNGDHNCEAHRRAEIPAINRHGSARGLARLYGALAAGGTLDDFEVLSRETTENLCLEEFDGVERTLGIDGRFGRDFMLNSGSVGRGIHFGSSPRAFGHPGAGGSVGFADPDARLGFGYVCNRMGSELVSDPRARTLIEACTRAIAH